jgi:hypothetical protein
MKTCKLCELEVERTTKHHLIPRTVHKNKWFKKTFTKEQLHKTVDLCKSCHREIHRQIPEKEMGRYFNTLPKLKANENVMKYVEWMRR